MDNKLLESYLETIYELVIDEGKIVTYKSLSRNLGVHINTAKQLLYAFLLKQKDEGTCPVSATYLLAGKFDDGSFNVTVINESDLKCTCEKFAQITSQHVYSVQKGSELKDVRVLAGISKGSKNFESSNVVIKCSKSCLKGKDEKKRATTPESNTQMVKSEQDNHTQSESVQKFQKIENGGTDRKTESPLESKKQTTAKSPVKKSSPNYKSETKSPTKANLDKRPSSSKTKKPTQNIANFFANATQKNSEKKAAVIEKINGVSSNEETIKPTVPSPEKMEINVIDEIKSQATTNLKRDKSKESLKKKKKGSKRKRIQVFSDSDESDSSEGEEPPFQREDENDYDEEKEEEENRKPPSAVLEEEDVKEIKETPRNKHKKRKIVDKTVMNEDGYLETRKEVVFETDSEPEDLESGEKDNSSNHQHKKARGDDGEEKSKNVPAANAVKKQSSLLSFFKKN